MAFDGYMEKRPPECKRGRPDSEAGTGGCPHLKETGGGFEGERYRCAVCGESFFLDYDEMR